MENETDTGMLQYVFGSQGLGDLGVQRFRCFRDLRLRAKRYRA